MKAHKECRIKEARRQANLLILFFKPITPSQLSELSEESIKYVSFVLEIFVQKHIAKCINPESKTGRIYTLTEKGERLRQKQINKLGAESDEFLKRSNALSEFQGFMRGTDFDLYKTIVSGKDRKEFILKMRNLSRLKDYFTPTEVLDLYRKEGKSVPRSELYRAIKLFVDKGILSKFRAGRRNVCYRFTDKGWIIAKQI